MRPPCAGRVERSVGPVGGHVVGERHVPRAEIVVGPKRAQRVLDRVAALHADEGRDPAALELPLDVAGRKRECQPVGVSGDEPARNIDLLQLHPGVAAVLDLPRHVDRPELRADLALGQAGEIGVAAGVLPEIVRRDITGRWDLGTDAPGKIVVAVDQGRRAEESRARTSAGSGADAGRSRTA